MRKELWLSSYYETYFRVILHGSITIQYAAIEILMLSSLKNANNSYN